MTSIKRYEEKEKEQGAQKRPNKKTQKTSKKLGMMAAKEIRDKYKNLCHR